MEKQYEIPLAWAPHLGIGKWVEIFEAYGEAEGEKAIQVRSMRVAGKTLVFGRSSRPEGRRALHPHEGEVVYIDRGRDQTRFGIRLRP